MNNTLTVEIRQGFIWLILYVQGEEKCVKRSIFAVQVVDTVLDKANDFCRHAAITVGESGKEQRSYASQLQAASFQYQNIDHFLGPLLQKDRARAVEQLAVRPLLQNAQRRFVIPVQQMLVHYSLAILQLGSEMQQHVVQAVTRE